jgi:hypothetical protein
MPNLGPHLRHNQHHTLLHKKEQPFSQIGLHTHDQQSIPTHALNCISSFYYHLIIVFFTALQNASLYDLQKEKP